MNNDVFVVELGRLLVVRFEGVYNMGRAEEDFDTVALVMNMEIRWVGLRFGAEFADNLVEGGNILELLVPDLAVAASDKLDLEEGTKAEDESIGVGEEEEYDTLAVHTLADSGHDGAAAAVDVVAAAAAGSGWVDEADMAVDTAVDTTVAEALHMTDSWEAGIENY